MKPDNQKSKNKNSFSFSQKHLLNRMKLRLTAIMFVFGVIIGSRNIMPYEIPPFILLIVLVIVGSVIEFLPRERIRTVFDKEKRNNTVINGFGVLKNLIYFGVLFVFGFFIGFWFR